MMKKTVVRNASIILGGYLVLALVANYGAGVVLEYMPRVLLFGALSTVVMMGYLCQSHQKKWIDTLFIVSPYIVGTVFYGLARMLHHAELIRIYRLIVPYAYAQVDLINKVTFGMFSKDVQTVLTMILFAGLSYGCLKLGMYLRQDEKTFSKLMYNNILIFGIHFYIVTLLGQLVLDHPTLLTRNQSRMISGAIVTVLIFIIYFGIGKFSKSCQHLGLQIISCCSVSVTALGMYVASLFLLYPSGRYEIFILPIAQSFFGVLGKELALKLGAQAAYISQYGLVVSLLLMIMPIILVCVGHSASQQVNSQKGATEEEHNGEVLSH